MSKIKPRTNQVSLSQEEDSEYLQKYEMSRRDFLIDTLAAGRACCSAGTGRKQPRLGQYHATRR